MEILLVAFAKNPVPLIRGVVMAYERMHWFTDKEAWALFRLFAILEAVGWTMLIGAIFYRAFDGPGAAIAISLAGRAHGLFFTLYFVFVILTCRSMEWGIWWVAAALIAGIPPYTSLIFEQIMAYDRKKRPVFVAPPGGLD